MSILLSPNEAENTRCRAIILYNLEHPKSCNEYERDAAGNRAIAKAQAKRILNEAIKQTVVIINQGGIFAIDDSKTWKFFYELRKEIEG